MNNITLVQHEYVCHTAKCVCSCLFVLPRKGCNSVGQCQVDSQVEIGQITAVKCLSAEAGPPTSRSGWEGLRVTDPEGLRTLKRMDILVSRLLRCRIEHQILKLDSILGGFVPLGTHMEFVTVVCAVDTLNGFGGALKVTLPANFDGLQEMHLMHKLPTLFSPFPNPLSSELGTRNMSIHMCMSSACCFIQLLHTFEPALPVQS
jgi:hypothetical protein